MGRRKMTENEARKLITKFCEDRMNFARGKDMSDKELDGFCKFSDALNLSISSLEEIQQYRAIGTVEECREAREKQIPKKPIHDGLYACPNCHTIMLQGAFEARGRCCKECGQVLDWSEAV